MVLITLFQLGMKLLCMVLERKSSPAMFMFRANTSTISSSMRREAHFQKSFPVEGIDYREMVIIEMGRLHLFNRICMEPVLEDKVEKGHVLRPVLGKIIGVVQDGLFLAGQLIKGIRYQGIFAQVEVVDMNDLIGFQEVIQVCIKPDDGLVEIHIRRILMIQVVQFLMNQHFHIIVFEPFGII